MTKRLSAQKFGVLYAYIHFAVEVACFFLLYNRFESGPLGVMYFLLFDALAFVPQSFLGILNDKYPNLNIGLIGSVFMVLSFFVPINIISIVLLTLGNALLHVSGAQYTMHGADGKLGPLGTFVGAGSFGLVTGKLLGGAGYEWGMIIPVVLMLVAMVMTIVLPRYYEQVDDCHKFNAGADKSAGLVILLAFIVVAIRSYVGYAIPTGWNKSNIQTIALFLFMGAGKIAGGFVADKIGYRKTAALSLGFSLPFLVFGDSIMWLSLIGVALFSMTMTLTVGIIASKIPRMPGLAFGITTVALFLGVFPAFFIRPDTLIEHQLVSGILNIIALICLLMSIKSNSKKREGC